MFPLPNVNRATLEKILPYFNAHFGTEEGVPDASTMSEEALKDFDQTFLKMPYSTLFEIMEVRCKPNGFVMLLQQPITNVNIIIMRVF